MTDFSQTWSYGIERRVSNPRWTLWLTALLSGAAHAAVLFFVLPVMSVQLPIETSSGRVSLQLVAQQRTTRPASRPAPRLPVERLTPEEIQPPKEIVREVVPIVPMELAPVPVEVAPEPPKAEPVQEIAMAEPVSVAVDPAPSDPTRDPVVAQSDHSLQAAESVSDPEPATGTQEAGPQDVQTAAPAYSSNPKPEYPIAAQRLAQQGKVVLRVIVSEAGDVLSLTIQKSSGYRILDASAERTVRLWKFVPARRGATAVSSVCLVPITFNMRKGVELE